MKFKEFKETELWKNADCVDYLDENGNEIILTTEIKRRWLLNREVVSYETEKYYIKENMYLTKLVLVLRTKRK